MRGRNLRYNYPRGLLSSVVGTPSFHDPETSHSHHLYQGPGLDVLSQDGTGRSPVTCHISSVPHVCPSLSGPWKVLRVFPRFSSSTLPLSCPCLSHSSQMSHYPFLLPLRTGCRVSVTTSVAAGRRGEVCTVDLCPPLRRRPRAHSRVCVHVWGAVRRPVCGSRGPPRGVSTPGSPRSRLLVPGVRSHLLCRSRRRTPPVSPVRD